MMSEETLREIAGPRAEFISPERARSLLEQPSEYRPRVYALMPDGNQIVRLGSVYYLEGYNPEHIWLSHTTVGDMIRKAK